MITFEGDNYASLADAVKAAEAVAKKKYTKGSKKSFEISLDCAEYAVNSKIQLPSGVSIIGRKDGDNITKVVVNNSYSGVVFAINGDSDVMIRNLELVLPKGKKNDSTKGIAVNSGKALEMSNCIVSAPKGEVSKLAISVSGIANLDSCSFIGSRVAFEKGSSGQLSNVSIESNDTEDNDSCGLSLYGDNIVTKASQVLNFAVGVNLHGSALVLESVKVDARLVGIDIDAGNVIIRDKCTVSSSEGRAIKAREDTKSELFDCVITNSNIGITLEGCARMQMKDCTMNNIARVGIRVETEAVLEMIDSAIIGNGLEETVGKDKTAKLDAITVAKKGSAVLKNCKIRDIMGRGIVIQGEGTTLTFQNLAINDCGDRCILATGGASVRGTGGNIVTSQGVVFHLNDKGTIADIEDLEITGGNTGVLIKQGAEAEFRKVKMKDNNKKGVEIIDATARLTRCNCFTPGLVAIIAKKGANITLRSCHLRRAKEAGLKVIGASTECTAINCGFLQNEIGLYADAAKTIVEGCSFVESQTKSIEIHNMELKKSTREGNLNKEAPIKLRWCNYIERILQGEDVCNNMELLNAVTTEGSFYGAFDYEYRMYCSTLLERMRQAKKFSESDEPGTFDLAQTIMTSVKHVYMLIPEVKQILLMNLADNPSLGMFCLKFKLGDTNDGLYTIKELVHSWDKLPRTITYDEALKALDDAFKHKVISEDVYDENRTLVEEWQRTNFVDSKYNRRRDYLLTTAKEDPLRCWYFLYKEPEAKLRDEVLKFLAAPGKHEPAPEEQPVHRFHGSWVSSWAMNSLGPKFLNKPPSRDEKGLFKAWCNALLDLGRAREVLNAYTGIDSSAQDDEDKLIQYEAHKMIGDKTAEEQIQALFPGKGFDHVVAIAFNLFPGEGILPGFFRRYVKSDPGAEQLLDFLSNVPFRDGRREVVLATMAQYFLPDDLTEPKIDDRGNNSANYESCPICFVQKLFPWNELRLKNCNNDHHFCLDCIRGSMSTGVPNLWGLCPGEDDHGKSCGAIATRRDMEMCGIEREKIYNILERTVVERLRSIPGWKTCNIPGCIGGRSNVKLKYYKCRLCQSMVTLDGGKTDPTIDIKLLQGLDVNEAKRGNGVYRECYHCATHYEKGNACSTLTCSVCKQTFSMSYGPDNITHRFDETGIQAQHYVPKKEGILWNLGVFKDKKGKPLKLGQVLTDAETEEVIRRAKLKLRDYLED